MIVELSEVTSNFRGRISADHLTADLLFPVHLGGDFGTLSKCHRTQFVEVAERRQSKGRECTVWHVEVCDGMGYLRTSVVREASPPSPVADAHPALTTTSSFVKSRVVRWRAMQIVRRLRDPCRVLACGDTGTQIERTIVVRTNERQVLASRAPIRLGLPVWIAGGVVAALGLIVLVGNVQHLRLVQGFEDPLWNGDLDGSYAELIGHGVLLIASLLLVVLAFRYRFGWAYGAWALVLAGLVIDDFFLLHERGGEYLAGALSLPSVLNLRPVDLGELIVWAIEAAILGLVLIVAHLTSSRVVRRNSWGLLALMVLLALFAVLIDMIHIAVESDISQRFNSLFGLTETAGELGVMTLILLYVVQISRGSGPSASGSGGAEGSRAKHR